MKKFDNFIGSLNALETTDFTKAEVDVIYRSGIAHQFSLTIELAWKCMKDILREHGSNIADTGSPRIVLKLAYQFALIDDFDVWDDMWHKRNVCNHIYNEEEVDELVILVKDKYLQAFRDLKDKLAPMAAQYGLPFTDEEIAELEKARQKCIG